MVWDVIGNDMVLSGDDQGMVWDGTGWYWMLYDGMVLNGMEQYGVVGPGMVGGWQGWDGMRLDGMGWYWAVWD
jgi:hypothetical protein